MKTTAESPSLRILCISPLFVPFADSEAFCAAKMVQALLECGASVTVLRSSDIRRSGRHDSSRMWHSMREVTVDIPQFQQPNLQHSVVAASRFQTPFFARWVDKVVAVAKQLHSVRKFDLVYSRSLPMIAHVAGFWCARKLKLPWIANIDDPWEIGFFPGAESPNLSAFTTRAHKFWLRRTLLNADLVTYPCKGLQNFHTKLAKLDHAAEIIPHIGYRPKALSHSPIGYFRLVHAGKLGTNEVTRRSTKAFLLGLKSFLDTSADAAALTRFILVGPEDKETQSWVCQLGLERNVENLGSVNYEDSLDYIASASACVLIECGTDESIFFPSKLADYLVCGKPVIALSPRTGIAADFASRGELIRIDHDREAVRNALTALYSEFKLGTLSSRNPSDRLIARLQGESVAREFLTKGQLLISRLRKGYCGSQSRAVSPAESPL
jgi:glycosyltransferase involved in cell wall biosynthesis